MPTIKCILCPVDFSETSDQALAYATELARQFQAGIKLLHVIQLPAHPMDTNDLMPLEDFETEYAARFQAQLEGLVQRERDKGVEVEGLQTTGIPHDEIIHAAEELNADLIVMGTHGRTGLAHFLIGSVAERVVRMSPLPVLTVRAKT